MKHKVTVLICLIVIIVLGLYAKQIHDNYQNKEAHAVAAAQAVQLKAKAVANQREAEFQAGVKLDEAQCARDQAAYNTLVAGVKVKTVAPDCVVDLQ